MRNGGRWLLALGLLIVSTLFVMASSEQGRRLFSGWSFTKSVDVKTAGQDRGYYYRFKAG
jgi:hypothetical protein